MLGWERIRAGVHYTTGRPKDRRDQRKALAERRSGRQQDSDALILEAQSAATSRLERRRSKINGKIDRMVKRMLAESVGKHVNLGPRGYYVWDASAGRHVNYQTISEVCQAIGVNAGMSVYRECIRPAVNYF
jgi:hypothetical protein